MSVTDYEKIISSSYIDFDNITFTNYTDYDNMTLTNCTKNDDNIDIIIPSLLFKTPSGLSFLCLISLMVYTLIKPLYNNK